MMYLVAREGSLEETCRFHFPSCITDNKSTAIAIAQNINKNVSVGFAVVFSIPQANEFEFGKSQVERIWP